MGEQSLSYQFPTSWLYALKMFNRPERRNIPVFSANANYASTWEGILQNNLVVNEMLFP